MDNPNKPAAAAQPMKWESVLAVFYACAAHRIHLGVIAAGLAMAFVAKAFGWHLAAAIALLVAGLSAACLVIVFPIVVLVALCAERISIAVHRHRIESLAAVVLPEELRMEPPANDRGGEVFWKGIPVGRVNWVTDGRGRHRWYSPHNIHIGRYPTKMAAALALTQSHLYVNRHDDQVIAALAENSSLSSR